MKGYADLAGLSGKADEVTDLILLFTDHIAAPLGAYICRVNSACGYVEPVAGPVFLGLTLGGYSDFPFEHDVCGDTRMGVVGVVCSGAVAMGEYS